MNKVIDYIISLTNLYGLVSKDKVVEIYNMQNGENIDIAVINKICQKNLEELAGNFVEIYGDYFVTEAIMEFDEFEEQLRQRQGKPYYIPEQEELLKYRDEAYYEIIKEYTALLNYVTKHFYDGDEEEAEMLVEDIQGLIHVGASMGTIFNEFNSRDISFRNEKQISELMQLVMELANNTRLWENNGHTPSELFELMEDPNLKPLPANGIPNLVGMLGNTAKKVGRNEPCPCGSGKKYKKCCLGKDELS